MRESLQSSLKGKIVHWETDFYNHKKRENHPPECRTDIFFLSLTMLPRMA